MPPVKLHKTPPVAPSFLHYDPEIDGVTNGLLQNWGGCRERARLSIKGYTKRQASFALAYGDLTHWLFQHIYEDHRKGVLPLKNGSLDTSYVLRQIAKLEAIWRKENPMAGQDALQHLELTMLLNEQLMPFYFEHWKKDFKEIKWVGLESEFKVPFEVRRQGITYKTFLRGKRDGVYTEGGGDWLFETKTKSRIDEGTMQDILGFESQVNLYLVSLWKETGRVPKGVRYNVIRRPGLRQKVKESLPEFAQRLADDVVLRPNWYFMRHKMKITERELDVFVGDLEDRVWEFMHWAKGIGGHWKESSQCENKYGVCQYLSICARRDFAPFFIRDRVFGELSGEAE